MLLGSPGELQLTHTNCLGSSFFLIIADNLKEDCYCCSCGGNKDGSFGARLELGVATYELPPPVGCGIDLN